MQDNGFWVGFEPVNDDDGGILSFDIWVIQHTEQPLHVSYNYLEGAASRYARKFQMAEQEKLMLHTIAFDQLNNNPCLKFRIWLTRPIDGKAGQFDKEWKIKAKTFFRKLTSVPWLENEVYLHHLFAEFPPGEQQKGPQLKKFKKAFPSRLANRKRKQDIVEKANMPDYLDLHAEKLFSSTKGETSHEILMRQLDEFQKYIDRAVYFNLDRVYIVHGQGKGKLRSEVHRLLDEYPHVASYNNDYNPRFGNGATEVIFG